MYDAPRTQNGPYEAFYSRPAERSTFTRVKRHIRVK